MKDYIFIYCENYNTKLITSKFHFINYLLKKNSRIIYVESPISILSIIFNLKIFFENFKKLFSYEKRDNLIITNNICFLPFHRFFRINLFNKINQIFNVYKINRIIRKYNFNDINLIIYSPLINDQIDKINNINKKIFIINDDYSAFDEKYSSDLIKSYCNNIFKKSNFIFYNSNYCLNNLITKENLIQQKNTLKISHGVTKKNNKFTSKLKKIRNIFYYGQINKINSNIILDLARKYDNLNFHIFGNLKNSDYIKFSNLNNLNLYKSIDRDKLMQIISKFDIALFPFLNNNLTNSMLPIKIYEMLNLNIPIITSKLSSIYEIFKNNVYYISEKNIDYDFTKIIHSLENTNYFRHFEIAEWDDIFSKMEKNINESI